MEDLLGPVTYDNCMLKYGIKPNVLIITVQTDNSRMLLRSEVVTVYLDKCKHTGR